jgi:hypothetical protein
LVKAGGKEDNSVDDLLKFVLKKFKNVFRACFFFFFVLASDRCKKSGWEILHRSPKARIFRELFKGVINFLEFDTGGNVNLIQCNEEVILTKYSKNQFLTFL